MPNEPTLPLTEPRDPRISEAQASKMDKASKRLNYTPDWYWTVDVITQTGAAAIRGLRLEGPVFDESEVIDRLNPGVYRAKLYAKGGGLVYTSDEFKVSDTTLRTPGQEPPAAAPVVSGKVESASEMAEMREAMKTLREEVAQRRRESVGFTMADLPGIITAAGTALGALAPLLKRDTLTLKDILPLVTKSSVAEAVDGMVALQKLQASGGGGDGGGSDDTAMMSLLAPIVAKLIDQRPAPQPPRPAQVRPVPPSGAGPRPGLAAPTVPAPRPGPSVPATPEPGVHNLISPLTHTGPGAEESASAPAPTDAGGTPDLATLAAMPPIAQLIALGSGTGLTPEAIAPGVWELWVKDAEGDEEKALVMLNSMSAEEIANAWIGTTAVMQMVAREYVVAAAEAMGVIGRDEDEDEEDDG